jgi:hypothetical protein
MKKTITILSAVVLLLASCGNEKTAKKLEQKEDYRYVEIEECTIPIPKKFKLKESNNSKRIYSFDDKNHKLHIIHINKRYEDDYINMKEFIAQGRNRAIVSETERDNFKILESTIYDDTMYYMYGKKSAIGLTTSNKAELNYLLDYCKKTWKLNKGEK